jgi:hydrophobic/amphiphilic exporter-1 (mainly G- bacteria), HAE1 family
MTSEQTKPGWNYRIVNYFLHNRQLTILLLLILIIGGVYSFLNLRVEGFPAVQIPVAVVTTVVPGAGPETVNDTVTEPLEAVLRDLKNIKEVSSNSQPNVSVIVLNFEEGVEINQAAQDARTKIASVQLPEGVQQPDVILPDIGGAPFIVAVSGPLNLQDLEKEAQPLKEKLLEIKGVKSFTSISGVEQNLYIDLPIQYQLPQITTQIQTANVAFPLGKTIVNGQEIPVAGRSAISSLDDVRNLPITIPGPTPRIAKLSDIASVYAGVDANGRVHRVGYLDSGEQKFKIQPALLYEVRLEKDVDLLDMGAKVVKAVEDAQATGDKIDYAIVFDQAAQAQTQVDEILNGAIGGKWKGIEGSLANIGYVFGGIWLLIIAMLLFLDWRSALVSALAIPLSFLFTFIYLGLTGTHLNTLVLFSLVLVLGLIVDPAIVVLESMKRYMEIGHKGREAVLRSIDVIGLGLFMAVLTSFIVFVPFGLVSGTFGEIIKYIPATVIPAIIASYFIPLIFLTWIGSKVLKAKHSGELRDEDDIHTLWPIARWFIRANRYILHHRLLQIAVVILGLVIPIVISAALFQTGKVRQVQFAQPDDVEFVQLSIPRPANQTYSGLQTQAAQVEDILKTQVSYMKTFFYQSFDGSSTNASMSVFVELLPPVDRTKKSPEIISDIESQLRQKFGEQATAAALGGGPPEEAYPINVKIFDNDPAKLSEASKRIADELHTYGEVDLVKTDLDNPGSELAVVVDEQKAAEHGLSPAAVYGQVNGILGERTIFRLNEQDVILRVPTDGKPTSVEALKEVTIFGASGPVKLSDVAEVINATVPGSIRRLNGERFTQVSARIKDNRDAINVQRRITDWTKAHAGELGLPNRAFEDRAGVNEFEKSFQELFLAIAISIIATYLVFVLFFRSFIQPFIILFAVPLILIGVFPALAGFNQGQFGFLETIGIIMVIGIVENVGIFLIDYANRKVKEGMTKKEAIALASGIRFRPVILTKITALAGLLPLAIFSPFWRGLALVVIFGILSSGILSLFTTPVLYSWFTRQKKHQQPLL